MQGGQSITRKLKEAILCEEKTFRVPPPLDHPEKNPLGLWFLVGKTELRADSALEDPEHFEGTLLSCPMGTTRIIDRSNLPEAC